MKQLTESSFGQSNLTSTGEQFENAPPIPDFTLNPTFLSSMERLNTAMQDVQQVVNMWNDHYSRYHRVIR